MIHQALDDHFEDAPAFDLIRHNEIGAQVTRLQARLRYRLLGIEAARRYLANRDIDQELADGWLLEFKEIS